MGRCYASRQLERSIQRETIRRQPKPSLSAYTKGGRLYLTLSGVSGKSVFVVKVRDALLMPVVIPETGNLKIEKNEKVSSRIPCQKASTTRTFSMSA
jgi:hypothetical protein